MRSSPQRSTHIYEHCATPEISRRWRKLGMGTMWRCTCGQQFWLRSRSCAGGNEDIWEWIKL